MLQYLVHFIVIAPPKFDHFSSKCWQFLSQYHQLYIFSFNQITPHYGNWWWWRSYRRNRLRNAQHAETVASLLPSQLEVFTKVANTCSSSSRILKPATSKISSDSLVQVRVLLACLSEIVFWCYLHRELARKGIITAKCHVLWHVWNS